MANQYEQSLLDQGVTQSYIDSERAKGKSGLLSGSNVDQQDVSGLLAGFKATPQQVFSGQNVQQTMNAPLAAPDYSDPLKLRDYFYNSPTIQGERTALSDLNNQIAKLKENTRGQQNYLENQTLPMGVITGQQANQLRLSDSAQQTLSEQQQIRQANLSTFLSEADQKFQIAYEQRGQIQNLISQTGGKAGISYADTFETATAKATKYIEKQAKEAKKEAYKDNLKAQLLAIGKSTKGNTKELEKKLKKYNKEAVAEAKKNADLDYQIKLKSLKGGSGGGTIGQRSGAIVSQAQDALLASKGEDGKVDPGVYAQYRAQYANETGDVTGFDQQFAGLLSSQEQGNLGIQTVSKPATAAQSKIGGYYSRALDAANALQSVESNIAGLGVLGQTQLNYAPNILKSSEQKIQTQAERQFIEAYLRKDSGAAIPTDEYKNARQTYFPQPGDDANTLARKSQARQSVINALQAEAGPAAQNYSTIGGGGSSSTLSDEDTLRNMGYTDDQIEYLKSQ